MTNILWLREKSIAEIETLRTCHWENSALKPVDELGKMERGYSDVAVQTSLNIAAIRCKGNKVVDVLSTYVETMNKK